MKNINKILSNFRGTKIVIIGDVMLDRYLQGNVSRINPEAPVPIVSLENEFNELGGAANVASNVVSLGGRVSLFGFVGKDKNAEIVKELLKEKGIAYFLDENQVTTQKTRIIGGEQQLLRCDKEETSEKSFSETTKEKMINEIREAKIILISDYAKGAVNYGLIKTLSAFKNKIIVDPKPKNKELYKGVFLISPNEKEAKEMALCSDLKKSGEILRENLETNVLVTRGKEGMSLFSDQYLEIPTYARAVYDVTGAGDSAIAALALAVAAGARLSEAAIIANHAAGIAVEKTGTYSVSLKELTDKAISGEKKILDFNRLKSEVTDLKRKGKKLVWANGCFDLLHIGHLHYLKEAKKLGDVLIVGINSDDSVRKIKGEGRPIQTENERAEILSSLEFVDNIIVFPELTVEKYLAEFQPDIFVKGGDYSLDSIDQEERKIIENFRGQIKFIPPVEGKSSSSIIEKIKSN
ncbi:MAG: bifunctional heptose 7-phosphate kinase/heptose 1-phosphate adenyltransferase [Nanoarchaeota archaeon]|nr:bifunctional heptose 7-phosphate kinase/heptose 1-phosphate adenyltransferase [Nanoarchaeota archaeon]MBU1103993.1 bifunctional heptose 7-phosphate kinase/heptose 1-phosphate adenyltransferase [Nanoarchaeota archaeon]